MISLDEFCKVHPELSEPDSDARVELTVNHSTVRLTGILINVSDEYVTFAHLGHRFDIDRSNVVGIAPSQAEVPNPFGRGQTVELSVSLSARLRPHGSIVVSSLSENVPFAISQPSEIPENSYPHHTAAELAWLAENKIAAAGIEPMSTTSGTYCGHNTTSPKWSSTYSNGREDDGKSDEYYGDDATHDDTGSDD